MSETASRARDLTPKQREERAQVEAFAGTFMSMTRAMGDSHELRMARQRMDEAAQWAIKHVEGR